MAGRAASQTGNVCRLYPAGDGADSAASKIVGVFGCGPATRNEVRPGASTGLMSVRGAACRTAEGLASPIEGAAGCACAAGLTSAAHLQAGVLANGSSSRPRWLARGRSGVRAPRTGIELRVGGAGLVGAGLG
jgi:hypothetical protein